jgi:hypothetical protein
MPHSQLETTLPAWPTCSHCPITLG